MYSKLTCEMTGVTVCSLAVINVGKMDYNLSVRIILGEYSSFDYGY